MIPDLSDAKQWRLCAEEIRTAAEDMLGEQCRAIALRLEEDYDRLHDMPKPHSRRVAVLIIHIPSFGKGPDGKRLSRIDALLAKSPLRP